jgi:hypothetical protein
MRSKSIVLLLLASALGCSSSLGGGPAGTGGTVATGQAGTSGGTAGTGTGGGAGTGGTGGDVAGTAGTGGVAGPGGTGGATAGTGGVVNSCLPATPVYPGYWLTPHWQPDVVLDLGRYDGPAVVERSADNQLYLAFEPGSGGAGGAAAGGTGGGRGGAGGGATVGTRRVTIANGDRSMSVFRPGARVWLSKTRDPATQLGVAPPPVAFSVRDRQGGALLFGMSRDSLEASPVSFSAGGAVCSAVGVDYCLPSATVTYGSAQVNGDAPVLIRHAVPGVVSLNGAAYDVRVDARNTTVPNPADFRCWDYVPPNGITLDVEARNLDSLAAALDVGAPPACGQGNDPNHDVYVDIAGASIAKPFEGPAVYKGRESTDPDQYNFDLPGIVPPAGQSVPFLIVSGGANLFPEPAIGTQFWFSFSQSRFGVLRESQQGPIVFAALSGYLQPDAVAALASVLGFTVTFEKSCAYTSTQDLWDVVFGTSPATRVKSGAIGMLTIAGRSYRVWFWSDAGFRLVIYPAS